MSTTPISAQAVADFLRANPEFLKQHSDVFLNLELPHANKGKTISLAQQQVLGMRTELQNLESNFKELSYYAIENQTISQQLIDWCIKMLAVKEAANMPQVIKSSLEEIFGDLKVALKIWGVPVEPPFEETDVQIKQALVANKQIYCGQQYPEFIKQWFEEIPASATCLPLSNASGELFAVLVFASPDPQHFHEEMGHGFLEMIGELATAALSRLTA